VLIGTRYYIATDGRRAQQSLFRLARSGGRLFLSLLLKRTKLFGSFPGELACQDTALRRQRPGQPEARHASKNQGTAYFGAPGGTPKMKFRAADTIWTDQPSGEKLAR
jgi:hypothetical protein